MGPEFSKVPLLVETGTNQKIYMLVKIQSLVHRLWFNRRGKTAKTFYCRRDKVSRNKNFCFCQNLAVENDLSSNFSWSCSNFLYKTDTFATLYRLHKNGRRYLENDLLSATEEGVIIYIYLHCKQKRTKERTLGNTTKQSFS